jgi:beta-lactamase regulating signal transducer with metallopeptidase domain/Leucine-rich repeat (LRR) protein
MRLASDDLLQLAWTQAWQLAVLAVAIAVVVKLACRRRPHLAYLLWMLVIIKAITPPVWSSPTGAFSWAMKETIAEQTLPVSVPGPPPLIAFTPVEKPPASTSAGPPLATLPTPAPAPQPAVSVSIASTLLIGWCAGSLGLATLLLVRWIALLRQLRQTSQPASAALGRQFDALRQQLGLRRPVRLVVTTDNLGPAAFGWWRGTVLVPQAVIEQSQEHELAAILAHELAHLRRFDPLVGSLQLVVQCLWWFHPAVWWANRQIRVERERSCDEEVLAELACPPADYARLLVRILTWRQQFVPAVFWSGMRGTAATTARVRHVLETKSFRRRCPLAAWLIAALALGIVLPGAGGRFITAAPPEEAPAQATTLQTKQQAGFPAFPIAVPPELNDEKQTPDEAAAFQELSSRGAVWSFASGAIADSGMQHRRWAVTLPASFDSGETLLPLARLSRILLSVSVGQPMTAERMRAQLLSLRDLPAETSLLITYTPENASALDALLAIPNLTRLSLLCTGNGPPIAWASPKSRPFAISELKSIKHLSMSAADDDLPEIAQLTSLEQLGLIGSFSAEAVNQLKPLIHLKSLSLQGIGQPHTGTLDLDCLAGMRELERLLIGGALNDAAAERISLLARLHDLSISVDGMSNAGLAAIARASKLRSVTLSVGEAPKLSAAGFTSLNALKNLESLSIHGWAPPGKQAFELTDESVAGWEGLAKLQILVISHCSIGDVGIRTLSSLPTLYCLQLEGPLQVTDAGVAELARAHELGALVLIGAKITGVGLAALKECRSLRLVNLSGSPLTDAGMEALAPVKLLSQLDVSGTQVTDKGLAALNGQLPQLSRLNLARTSITDAGLSSLEQRANLKQLNLADTKVTVSGIGKLLDAHRELIVWSVDPEKPQTRQFDMRGLFQPIDASEVLSHLPPAEDAPAPASASPTVVAPKVASRETTSAEVEAMQQVSKRGLRWSMAKAFGLGEAKVQQRLNLPSSFDPGDTTLPLAALARNLAEVSVGQYFDPPVETERLRAQLRSLRELPASTKLVVNYAAENVAALNALVEIPNVTRLTLQCTTEGFAIRWSDAASRPFRLSKLKAIKTISLTASDADLPEIAAASTLESLSLSGDLSAEAIDQFEAPVQLKNLSLYGHHKQPPRALDLKCLAGMPELQDLHLGGDFSPSDAGAAQIGALAKLRQLTLRVDQLSDAGIASIARAGELRLLVLEAGQISPRLSAAGFAALGSLAKLDSFMFSGKELQTPFLLTDESVAGWNRLTGLRMLIVDSCSIGDAGIRNFASLPILHCLQLEGPLQVTDAGVAELSKAPELAAIVLNGSKVTGPGLAALNASRSLWLLNLADSPLTDAGIEALASYTRLAQLDVSGSKITDRGLAALKGHLPQLTRLNLARTDITDAGLSALEDRANLQELNLSGTKPTVSAIDKLLNARQELKIWSTDTEKAQTRAGKSGGPFEPIDLTQVIFNPPTDARVPAAADEKPAETKAQVDAE